MAFPFKAGGKKSPKGKKSMQGGKSMKGCR
jgi:hypothetical protein